MKKFKFPLMLFAICIALAASFAFNLPRAEEKKVTEYFYSETSTDFDVMKLASSWVGTSSAGGCDDEDGSIPCVFNYSGNLQTHLTGLGSAEAIVAAAETKRYP